jgi:CubicO group peptidase (beta-lactamase class C family)
MPNSRLAAEFDAKQVDALLKGALQAWQVPGVAVAIVHKGEVIYLKGHGVKQLGQPDAITPETLFPIASCSKAFTTTVMAMLIDDGQLAWDDHVHKHVPTFHLSDPLIDAEVTLRDLLCHRTGVRSHDLLWYNSPFSQEERIRRLAHLPVDQPFRASFHYQSSMFTVAGHAVSSASGSAWADLIRKRLLVPLDMKAVVLTTTDAQKTNDHASPHRRNKNGDVEVIDWYPMTQPEPAGSVHANARDLAKWLKFHLGDGTWNGKRLVSTKNLRETHSPQIVIPFKGVVKEQNPESTQMSYGLGWVVQDYRGRRMLDHGGMIDGFRTHVALLPDEGIGVVLLNNLDQTAMNLALTNSLLDLLLGEPKRDWNKHYQDVAKRAVTAAEQKLLDQWEQRRPGTKPSRELAAYSGKYEHAAYGVVEVSLERGSLVWKYNGQRGELEHYQHDTFVLGIERLGHPQVVFVLNRDGIAARMKVAEPLGIEFIRGKLK